MNPLVSTIPAQFRGLLPRVPVAAIVTHWTAGGPVCSDIDRAHYHFIIDQKGRITRGNHSIADNAAPLRSGSYAAHTRGFNAHNGGAVVGIAVCGMAGALGFPFRAGRFPITEKQMEVLTYAVAHLCLVYGVPVTPQTVLQHGEVQKNLGIMQLGKWDITRLPYAPEKKAPEVCAEFRAAVVRAVLELRGLTFRPRPPRLLLSVDGRAPVSVPGARLVSGAWFVTGAALSPLLSPVPKLEIQELPLRAHLLSAGYVLDESRSAANLFLGDAKDPRAVVFAQKAGKKAGAHV